MGGHDQNEIFASLPVRGRASCVHMLDSMMWRMRPPSASFMVPPAPDRTSSDLTRFLNALGRGERQPTASQMQPVYAELRAIAEQHLARERARHTLQPTALVNEAFLRLFDPDGVAWHDRNHFFAVAAKAMRRVLVDHARRRQRLKRGGGRLALTLNEAVDGRAAPQLDLLDLHLALEELSAEDEEKARIVELRYFGGLEMQEVADVLGVSKSTAERGWRSARAWLGVRLRECEDSHDG